MAKDAVARETLFALRDTIARLEGKPFATLAAAQEISAACLAGGGRDRQAKAPLVTGVPPFDEALEGGIRLDALTEIRSRFLRDAGASTGFALSLTAQIRRQDASTADRAPVLWVGDTVATMEAGLPYAVGLKDFGLEPHGFFRASPRRLDEALWLCETALASAAFAAVILEVRGNPAHFGLTESRRLALRAKAAGRPLFVLRQAGEEEASSAFHRLCVEPAPSVARPLPDGSMLGGSIGNPVFRLVLEKSRNPAPLSFSLEWNAHDRRFFPVCDRERPTHCGAQSANFGARLSASVDRPDRAQEMGSIVAFGRKA